jgi:hypothetical protein
MEIRVMMMITAVSVVAVKDTNMLVNCWLMMQFESNCILLKNKYNISFEIVSGIMILLFKEHKSWF